ERPSIRPVSRVSDIPRVDGRGCLPTVVVVAVRIVAAHFKTGNLHQRPTMAFIDTVVEGPMLDVHKRLLAGTEKDEPSRLGARVTDRRKPHAAVGQGIVVSAV